MKYLNLFENFDAKNSYKYCDSEEFWKGIERKPENFSEKEIFQIEKLLSQAEQKPRLWWGVGVDLKVEGISSKSIIKFDANKFDNEIEYQYHYVVNVYKTIDEYFFVLVDITKNLLATKQRLSTHNMSVGRKFIICDQKDQLFDWINDFIKWYKTNQLIFESFKNRISQSEYFKFINDKKTESFSKFEIDKIKQILSKAGLRIEGFLRQYKDNSGIQIEFVKQLLLTGNGSVIRYLYKCNIVKYEDEYYEATLTSWITNKNDVSKSVYFHCDQRDQLFEFINSLVFWYRTKDADLYKI